MKLHPAFESEGVLKTCQTFDARQPEIREAIDWADSVLPPAETVSFWDRLFNTKDPRAELADRWNAIPTTMNNPPWRDIRYGDFTGSSPVPTHYIISHTDMELLSRDKWHGRNPEITDDKRGLVLRAANNAFRLDNMWFSEAMLFTYAVHTEYKRLLVKGKLAA